MKKNPIVPYLLIIAFGLGLIFFMSLGGIDKKEEAEKNAEDPKTEETDKTESAEPDAEKITSAKCISCHGEGLKGGMGPSLHKTGLKADEVEKIIRDGQKSMPPGILTDDKEITAVAKYIADLK